MFVTKVTLHVKCSNVTYFFLSLQYNDNDDHFPNKNEMTQGDKLRVLKSRRPARAVNTGSLK